MRASPADEPSRVAGNEPACSSTGVGSALQVLRDGGTHADEGSARQTARMAVMVRVVAVLTVFAVLAIALTWVLQRRLVYLPLAAPAARAEEVFEGGHTVRLHTDDGLHLTAWHAPATTSATGATVLVLPGNAGSRAARIPLARALTARGFDVLLVDYRGYGGNPGSPTEEGLAADARAAHRHLVVEADVNPARLVLFGESLGAAVATRLALERPVAGLVLRSPFTSLADVGAQHYPYLPVRAMLRDRFPVQETVGRLTVPVTVVAGGADEIVPPAQSRAVAAAASASYVEVPGARHNDPDLSYGPLIADAVARISP